MSDAVAVLIPARRASSRLPDKLLLAETGIPLLVHTCRRAAAAFGSEKVTVCVDDEDLHRVVREAGFNAVMTRPDHQSGTDRIAEAASDIDADICINVQGDEPEIDPAHIRLLAGLLSENPWADMATLAVSGGLEEQQDPNAVKVAIGHGGRVLLFTRSPFPWDRELGGPAETCLRHIGIYAYRRAVLLGYRNLPASRFEDIEKLEQMRAIEAGIGMVCALVEEAAPGIDVREDYDSFLYRFFRRQQ